MNIKLRSAITNRNLLEFSYKGHHRVVEPFTYGITPKGNEVLRAYQTDGTSESGAVPDWRLFSVNKIEGLVILDSHFTQARPGYTSGDRAMNIIYAEF
jgi:predicted DNA-binding transcriptional regulator YafY